MASEKFPISMTKFVVAMSPKSIAPVPPVVFFQHSIRRLVLGWLATEVVTFFGLTAAGENLYTLLAKVFGSPPHKV